MAKWKDITGQKFGRLTAVSKLPENDPLGMALWACLCECGKPTVARGSELRAGRWRSCGCLGIEARRAATITHGHTTGGSRSATYQGWCAMIQRCRNPTSTSYYKYGERGITVCDRWSDYRNFLADMGERPRGMSLDRINNDGNYEPSNCRWATPREQSNNTRMSRRLTHDGRTMTITEWAREIGVSAGCIRRRLSMGYTPPRLFRPVTRPPKA